MLLHIIIPTLKRLGTLDVVFEFYDCFDNSFRIDHTFYI